MTLSHKKIDYIRGTCIPPPLGLYDNEGIIDPQTNRITLAMDWYKNDEEESQ